MCEILIFRWKINKIKKIKIRNPAFLQKEFINKYGCAITASRRSHVSGAAITTNDDEMI